MFLFCEAKAKTASRGREIFPSGKILVTTNIDCASILVMEGLNNPESFEDFKNRVAEIFKSEGFSENLNSEIEKWHSRRQRETDMPGGTIEQRVIFQMELAQVYIKIGKNDSAFDTLSDAWTEADQGGLADLVKEITDLMNSMP